MRVTNSPFAPLLEAQGVVLLDGGLSTQLEAQGQDLAHPLWSARVLLEDPDQLREAHLAFLRAGADCIIAGSYQISVAGGQALGFSRARTLQLVEQSVDVACAARDQFLGEDVAQGRIAPLVAVSVGPYGAALADGSEYSGDYEVSRAQLRDFHESRWEALVTSGADVVACETMPNLLEVEVLVELLQQQPELPAWISFSCRDGEHISDGTPIDRAASVAAAAANVCAIGVNCTRPEHVPSLIDRASKSAPDCATVAYPNAGFRYDGDARAWVGEAAAADAAGFAEQATDWWDRGATLIGGCCGTGPAHVEALRSTLVRS